MRSWNFKQEGGMELFLDLYEGPPAHLTVGIETGKVYLETEIKDPHILIDIATALLQTVLADKKVKITNR